MREKMPLPNENCIAIDPLQPIGVGSLPSLEAKLIHPYFERQLPYAFGTLGLYTASKILRDETMYSKPITRRSLIKGICGGVLAFGSGSLFTPDQTLKHLYDIDPKIAYLYQDSPIALHFLSLNNSIHNMRQREARNEQLHVGDIATTYQANAKASEIHIPLYEPNGSEHLVTCYYAHEGEFDLHMPDSIEHLAMRSDIAHRNSDSAMLVPFNATAHQLIHFGEAVSVHNPPPLSMDEISVLYGSKNLLIPPDSHPSSPIWHHAQTMLTVPNTELPELTYRKNDPTHQGLGKTKNGFRIIQQTEMENMIQYRRLPQDISWASLQQFCFDPGNGTKLGKNFAWGTDYHRNFHVLAQTSDNKSLIIDCSPYCSFNNQDYTDVLLQVAQRLGVEFNLVACLDVGLAGGAVLKQNKSIYRPSDNEALNPSSIGKMHTVSTFLAHK